MEKDIGQGRGDTIGVKVLSLFDGISCGMIAFERAGIVVDEYHAFEIDKYAIKISETNYPTIKRHGDVREANFTKFENIDILIGGSPCQGFSFAGKQLNFNDPRSKLFFEYVRALKEAKPKYFLLENVVMKKEYENIISEYLGVQPILINSSLVSAQNRKRLYWTNIPNVEQPEDKNIYWGDIKQNNVEWSPIYYSDKAMEWIGKHGARKGKKLKVHSNDEKMQMIEASHFKKYSSQRFFGIIDRPAQIVGRRINENGVREDYNKDIEITQCLEVRGRNKVNCVSTVLKDTVISPLENGRYPNVYEQLEEGKHYRYITPIEAERCQTLPDDYTKAVSNTQRYKAIGNGWTVDVIAHIFSFLPNEFKRSKYEYE